MRKTIFISTLLISSLSYSQELTPVYEDSIGSSNFIKISSFNYYSSNRLQNEFTDKFIFGGEITNEMKDAASERLKTSNTFGLESEQRIDSYTPSVNPFKREQYGLMISFSDNHFVSSNISTDFFNTAMYGNAPYIGDTMDLSFTHLQYQHYQKIGIGFYDEKTLSSIQLSYVAGSRGLNMRLANSWMYSEPDSIQLNLVGTGHRTDAFYPYWAFQGSGFSVDLNYNFSFENKKGDRQILNLKINNLGAIFWNQNTSLYAVDSLSTYTGFNIQDFLTEDTTAFEEKYNFNDTLGILSETSTYTEVLPIELVVQKLPDLNSGKKLQAMFGFKAILTSDYFPYLFAGAYYQPIDNFSMSTRVSYGGFGGVKWGLNFNYWMKAKAYLALGTYDMLGFISKKYGFGRSLNFTAYFKM